MSPDTAAALITLSGVILTAILGLAGTILTVWLVGRKDRAQQRQVDADRHKENRGRLDQMAATIAHMQSQLPEDGLATWIAAVQANTATLERHGQAMSRLADSIDALDQRVIGVEGAVAALQAGGTA